MSEFREIGPIVRLQIQRESLKVADPPRKRYDPAPILSGLEMRVENGIATIEEGGEAVLDVHCQAHPRSRNRGNGNMLSIGFTSHYDKMRAEFGAHLTDGIAGENVLVDAGGMFALDDLEAGMRIQLSDGGVVDLSPVVVATPCVEFSRFCMGDPDADPRDVSQTLRFLDGGTRGFYAYVAGGLPATIRTGDLLLARV